jgi:hypothetical protein
MATERPELLYDGTGLPRRRSYDFHDEEGYARCEVRLAAKHHGRCSGGCGHWILAGEIYVHYWHAGRGRSAVCAPCDELAQCEDLWDPPGASLGDIADYAVECGFRRTERGWERAA